MLRIATLAVLALAVLAPAAAQAQREPKQTTYALIRCESPGGRDSFCPADTRRGVRITRILQGRCQLGRNWGYDGTGIWVRGCSAEFEIGNRGDTGGWGWGHNQGNTIVCASENFRYTLCASNTRGGARLVNQVSRAECVEGRTWGSDQRGIWVDQGCAGEFEVGGGGTGGGRPPGQGGNWGGGNQTGSTFICESRDGRRRYCDVDLRGRGATVIRNISREPCAEGSTWGIDSRGIWVDRGCRAEFRIIDTGSGGGRPPVDRPQPGGDVALASVRCESQDFRRRQCPLRANNVRRVELIRQTSRAACVRDQTWGWQAGSVWVDQGCAGEFAAYGR